MDGNVYQMHKDCKRFCASPALFPTTALGDTLCMARHFLRAWRKHRGKTLEQVADHLHMSHSQLSRIERMQQSYNQELLEALADLYGCDVVDLIIRDPSDPESMWTLWERAKPGERRQIAAVAETLLKATGT
jgi:transcriptional regulator with XRE-family HTH domain